MDTINIKTFQNSSEIQTTTKYSKHHQYMIKIIKEIEINVIDNHLDLPGGIDSTLSLGPELPFELSFKPKLELEELDDEDD